MMTDKYPYRPIWADNFYILPLNSKYCIGLDQYPDNRINQYFDP